MNHDWNSIYIKCGIILILWVGMIVAVLVDLWTGVSTSRAVGQRPRSDKFRRTVEKMGDYWRLLVMALVFDVIASIFPFYSLPYASILATLACIIIEGKSVVENLHAKKSAAAKIPDIVADIIRCTDREKAIELIKTLQELSSKKSTNYNKAIE